VSDCRREEFGVFRFLAIVGFLVLLTSNPIAAQQPTQAQRNAIRSACRSDFIANCAGVTPGGKEAYACLLRNNDKLSPACSTAVNAVAAKPQAPAAPAEPAPAAEEPTTTPSAASPTEPPAKATETSPQDQFKAVRQACTLNDFMAHCSWIAPSSPELLPCLKANAADLSAACQAAVQSLPPAPAPAAAESPPPAKKRPETKRVSAPASATPAAATATPAAAPAAAASKPSAQQLSAVRANCRSDFMANCSGVQPGGAEALQCLQRNSAKLSASCQTAVAAIGSGAAPASSSAPAATTAAPAAAPLGPMPVMRPRQALAILRICGADQRTLCAGVPVGGGRVISCLAENAASLSPGCYAALAAARR
jgi:hypothetical protein